MVNASGEKIVEFKDHDKDNANKDIDELVAFLENRQHEISRNINDYDGSKDFEAGMARIIIEAKKYRKSLQKQVAFYGK